MTLSPVPQAISEHCRAGSITVPTGRDAQATDVNRKLQLYGVIQAFRQGRMPDNSQVDKALSYLHEAEPLEVDKLSPDGKKLVQDFRRIITTARLIIKQKNPDELFQNFVWHTRDVEIENVKATAGKAPHVDRDKLTEYNRAAVRHLRTLLSLILTNSEVRKLLSDFSVIGRDLLAEGVSKVTEALRQDEEAISRGADEPTLTDKFVSENERKNSTAETPTLDMNKPHADFYVEQHSRADEREVETMHVEATEGQVGKGKKPVRAVQELTTDMRGKATEQQQNVQDFTQPQISTVGVLSELPEEGKAEGKKDLRERFKGIKGKFAERLPQDQSKTAADHVQKYFTTERRNQFIYRGKKIIVECQKHDDYLDAIKWLLSIAEEYAEFYESASEKGKESVTRVINDPAVRQTASELRQLLERFADGKGMEVIFHSIDAVIDDARRDEEFRAWLQRLNSFVRKLLLETGFVLEDACIHEGREIRESGRKFWDQKYRAHFDNVFNSVGDWFSAIGHDPVNKQFGEDWARLTRDLLFDNEGSLKFKSGLWSDIGSVIVPTIVNKAGYIPIPRIEYSNDALDLVLENLTLQGRDLFPNIVTLVAHNYLKFSPYSHISDEHHHEFTFTFAQMQAYMQDVAFYFRKKTGFPKVIDSGMADVVIGGSGLTAIVRLVSAGKDRSSVFKVKDVHVKVSSLKFSIRDSKHDLLYKTLKPLATGLVKRQIKRAIASAIKTGMEYVDGRLVSVRDHTKEAISGNETNRTQVLKELYKRQKEEDSIRSPESKSQFKVVSSKRLSVIDTGNPSDWISRISETEEKAVTGRDWRSEAFTIV